MGALNKSQWKRIFQTGPNGVAGCQPYDLPYRLLIEAAFAASDAMAAVSAAFTAALDAIVITIVLVRFTYIDLS